MSVWANAKDWKASSRFLAMVIQITNTITMGRLLPVRMRRQGIEMFSVEKSLNCQLTAWHVASTNAKWDISGATNAAT